MEAMTDPDVVVEVQKRYSVFYIIGAVAGSLSGILAFGLSQMNGMHGLGGWRWIFIMEGVVSRCCEWL